VNKQLLKPELRSSFYKGLIDFIQTYFFLMCCIFLIALSVFRNKPSNIPLTGHEMQLPILITFVLSIVFTQLRFRLIDKSIFKPLHVRFFGLEELATAVTWVIGIMGLAIAQDYKPQGDIERQLGLNIIGFLSLCVLGPIFEELFFRKHLQLKVFAALDRKWATVLTSILFMFGHFLYDLRTDRYAMIFFSGLVLGYVAEKRSWRHSLIVHSMGNTICYFLSWWYVKSGLMS
jgi:membrane protease YdiL (CAAX protease family)